MRKGGCAKLQPQASLGTPATGREGRSAARRPAGKAASAAWLEMGQELGEQKLDGLLDGEFA